MKPVKRCKVWKLEQAEIKAIISERVQARAALIRKEPGDVEKAWKDLKDCFLEEAVDVFLKKLWMFVGKHEILIDKKRLGGGTRRLRRR